MIWSIAFRQRHLRRDPGPSDSDLLALLALVRAAAPEVLVPHPEARDVLLRKVNIVCDHLN